MHTPLFLVLKNLNFLNIQEKRNRLLKGFYFQFEVVTYNKYQQMYIENQQLITPQVTSQTGCNIYTLIPFLPLEEPARQHVSYITRLINTTQRCNPGMFSSRKYHSLLQRIFNTLNRFVNTLLPVCFIMLQSMCTLVYTDTLQAFRQIYSKLRKELYVLVEGPT